MVGIFYVQKNILIKQNIGTDRLRDSGNFGLRFETPRNCHYLEMYETRFCRQTIKHMCFIQQTVRMGQAGLIASRASPSADSDSESLDESVWHSRHVDPSEADIYLDAMFGPLFYRFERIRKEQNGSPQWSDYRLVSIFLLLNVALQLSIAFKINQVTVATYGDVEHALFNGACWRLSSTGQDYIGLLYPDDVAKNPSNRNFDCVQPLLTLSMFPNQLDLDHDGFWTVDEALEMSQKLRERGSNMASNFTRVLEQMAKLDLKRPISRSTENPPR